MALSNCMGNLSNVSGSYMADHYHWTLHQLVWVNAGSTLLILLIVPLMPAVLLRRKDAG